MKNLFKYASLLLAAAMLFSCEKPNNGGEEGPLKVTADKTIIQTFDGDYATITVTIGDKVITEGVTFYDGDLKPIEIPDFKFSTKTPGEYKIIASYGTYTTKDEPLTIMAVSVKVPETPVDPNPNSTSFKARVFVNQFTTTGCGPCAVMKEKIHGAMEDKDGNPTALADKVVLTTCHSGLINNVGDPAYIHTDFDDFSSMSGFPYVFCDMYYGFNNTGVSSASELAAEFNKLYDSKKDVAAGIAVNSCVSGGQLVAKVTVKAAASGNYRIGLFLLEDGIYAQQNNASAEYMNTHDGVIRYMDSEYYSNGKKFYGHSVGKIEEGKTADYVFVWDLEKIWKDGDAKCQTYGASKWHSLETSMPNLHLAAFTCTVGTDSKGNETYYVNNVIDCPVNGSTPFEYR